MRLGMGPVLRFLNGMNYTLEGVPGTFVVEQDLNGEVLKHLPRAPTETTSPYANQDWSRNGDWGYKLVKGEDLQLAIAKELGYTG